jgi:predicted DNA-binding antitoxin AbrB/MazE fold protein
MPDLTVTYESGVLKPAIPLTFPEGQTLQIRIIEPESPALTLEQALQPLIRRGSLTMPPRDRATSLPETPLSLGTASEFETYGISQTSRNLLSESIIEDRGPL